MVTTGDVSEETVGKLAVLQGPQIPRPREVRDSSWHALMAAIDGKEDPVSTE